MMKKKMLCQDDAHLDEKCLLETPVQIPASLDCSDSDWQLLKYFVCVLCDR